MAVLAALAVGQAASCWEALGFAIEEGGIADGICRVGTVEVTFDPPVDGGAGRGVVGWSLAAVDLTGADLPAGGAAVDGLPTRFTDPAAPGCPPGRHPNGVTGIDHVVVATPDLERTVGALGALGIFERRRRDAGRPGGRAMTQVFFRLGEVILELVGSPDAAGDGPARFYGLAFNVADLEDTVAFLGDRLRPVRAAVQPGRFIATLDRAAGSSVDMAFMSS